MRGQIFRILLQLARDLADGRHKGLDIAFELRADAITSGLQRGVDRALALDDGLSQSVQRLGGIVKPTLFSAETQSQNICPLRTPLRARIISSS